MLFDICSQYIEEANRTNGRNADAKIYELCFAYFLRSLTTKETETLNKFFNL